MAEIFGITSVSIYNVYVTMVNRYGRKRVAVLTNEISRLTDNKYRRRMRRAKLILAGSVRDLLANIALLNRRRTPVVIFDSPLLLRNYPGVQLLDYKTDPSTLINKFSHTGIDYAKLFDAVEQRSATRHNIVRNNTDVLPEIIQEHIVTGFMNLYNSFMYSITTADNRTQIRNIIVRFVFEQLTLEEFNRQLQNAQVRLNSKSEPLYKAMVDYLSGSKGQSLRAALHEAVALENAADKAKGTRRTIRYKELCERYSVDKFDLRNLIILYRALAKK